MTHDADSRRQWLALGLISALIMPQTAAAILPPARPPSYSAYGPFQLCSDRFVIDVAEGEALHIVGDIARVINDREVLAIKFANSRYYSLVDTLGMKNGKIGQNRNGAGPAKMSMRRFDEATPDAGDTIRYAPHGLGNEDVRYQLGPSDKSDNAVIIGASSFDGSGKDERLLDRIKHPDTKSADCLPLSAIFNSDLNDGDAKRAYDLANYGADIYPPVPDPGPQFRCQAGIGFALEKGESLLRPWRPLGVDGEIYVNTGDTRIKIEQRFYNKERLGPGDPADMTEHPMSMLRKTEVTYYPSRGVGPPYAEPGVPELGSWAVKLIESYNYGVTFSFPASEKTGAGFRFLERLQFVKEDDPRCSSQH